MQKPVLARYDLPHLLPGLVDVITLFARVRDQKYCTYKPYHTLTRILTNYKQTGL